VTATVDPAIQQQYDQSSAARRSALTEVTGELNARQAEVAEQIKQDEAAFAALTKELTESTVDEPPAPARRPEDNDISASAEAYQERDEEEPAPPSPPPVTPKPVARVAVEDEEVPSFQWDEDPPAAPPAPVRPAAPAKRERARRDEDEDLSEHDWLE
jgi:hypothetical protein